MSNKKKEAEELAFNKHYSRFKVVVYYSSRDDVTHYGREREFETVSQMRHRHIDRVTLHRERGLDDCIKRIELCRNRYGPYDYAQIFDMRKKTIKPDGSVQKGRCIFNYNRDGQLVSWEEPFASPREKIIYTKVVFEDGFFKLKPIMPDEPLAQEQVDFKKEVAQAINRNQKPIK